MSDGPAIIVPRQHNATWEIYTGRDGIRLKFTQGKQVFDCIMSSDAVLSFAAQLHHIAKRYQAERVLQAGEIVGRM